MINLVYLVVFVIGGSGVTSQSIPQANMNQCQANAKVFNTGEKKAMPNEWLTGRTQKAYCIVGVK